jgi:5-methylcytosine-specific restriction endonuclease McrA
MAKKPHNIIQRNRQQAFFAQSKLCYYCNQPMWEKDINSFISQYQIKPTSANFLQCTAEHLTARKDGGKNFKANIVAACKYCNHTRHKSKNALCPADYKKRVRKLLSRNKWHKIIINPIPPLEALT